jgi:hypothetical protein
VYVKNVDAVFVADVYFDGGVLGHGDNLGQGLLKRVFFIARFVKPILKPWKPSAATRHYTHFGPGFVSQTLKPLKQGGSRK